MLFRSTELQGFFEYLGPYYNHISSIDIFSIMKKISFLASALIMCIFISCSEDDAPVVLTSDTFEASFSINPSTFPLGGGLDLSASDTGRVAQLDVEDIDWDIQVKTIRTQDGGRPGVFLFGDDQTTGSVKAVNVSELSGIATGSTGFSGFERVTAAMISALSADGVFDFDESSRDAALLATAYEALVIGDRIVNLEEAEQPVYLVEDRGGDYFKFQLIRREGGGAVFIRWAKFTQDAVE